MLASTEFREQRYKRREEGLHSKSQAGGAKTGILYALATSPTQLKKHHLSDRTKTSQHANACHHVLGSFSTRRQQKCSEHKEILLGLQVQKNSNERIIAVVS